MDDIGEQKMIDAKNDLRSDPRIRAAIAAFRDLILSNYPGTGFSESIGEDPIGVWLTAEVDIDDPDEVMDLVIDRLVAIQVDEGLPLYILPVRTRERDEAIYAREHAHLAEPLVSAIG
jgi:hypothetical protein